MKTYKILSILLSYPTAEIHDFLKDADSELETEALLPAEALKRVKTFTAHFAQQALTDWQAHYVQLFDYSRAASLYLFEHVQGDSRDRGQAMVDLIAFYKKYGLQPSTNELPDYLPVFLEFLSTLERHKAAEVLQEPIDIIARIHQKLQEKDNPYQHLMAALLALSPKKPKQEAVDKIIKNQKPLDLDKEYREEPVAFGGKPHCKSC